MHKEFDCAVIGNWHLAYVTAACLAKLGHRIALVNTEEAGEDDLPESPVYEPGLPELLASAKREGRLSYFEGFSEAWKAKYNWLAVDTPVNERDEVDLAPLRKIVSKITGTLIINSQVPLGFCESVAKDHALQVAYIPENLRLGQGIETFMRADRTVIGAESPQLREEIRGFLAGVESEFVLCDLATAEMIKHATNAFLATSISFSNELARIGEKYGVNNQLVGEALRMDKRIGKKAYVVPGLGFAGGTLPRDLRVLQDLGKKSQTPTPLMNAVLEVNDSTTQAVSDTVLSLFNGDLANKKVLLLGYTYKAETDTLRRSLSVTLADHFISKGAAVWGFDPFMNDRDLSEFNKGFQHFKNWASIPSCPDVILLLTPRQEFKELNWSILKDKGGVLSPMVIDLRSGVAAPEVLKSGFNYKSLWQPVLKSNEGAPL